MSLPNEYSIFCSKCSAYNLDSKTMLCQDCLREEITSKVSEVAKRSKGKNDKQVAKIIHDVFDKLNAQEKNE